MLRTTIGLCLLFALSCTLAQTAQNGDSTLYRGQQLPAGEIITTIALGSCNKQNKSQHIWPHIARQQPDLWIWLGDNIYGDTEDMAVMKAKYLKQKNHPEYRAFTEVVPVIGIWDDHDYGANDGGKEYPKRAESQHLLLDFLDVPPDAGARNRPGAYQAYTFGPVGKRVKIMLLDTRYFRDSLEKNPAEGPRYFPNEKGDLLGEAQWKWLERELRNSEAQVHLLATSIQFIAEEHFFEKWANFPRARRRMLDLLARTRPANPLFLSGDRHIAELSRMEVPGLDRPLYELTASGMTHTWRKSWNTDEPNRHRVGELLIAKNFGLIHIDWSGAEPDLRVEVRSDKGESLMEFRIQ